MADVRDDLEDLLGRCVDVDRDNVGAGNHHLMHGLFRDREDRGDHALLALLQNALGLAGLDEGLDLVLRDERRAHQRVAAKWSRDETGEVEEHTDQRPRDPRHELERPDEDEEHGLRVTSPDRTGHEYPEEHGNERQDRDGDGDRRDVTHDGRVSAEQELQEIGEPGREVRRGDAREGEDDEELRDLNRRQIFDRLAAHRAGTPATPPARGELFDELGAPDRMQRRLARREHGEDRDEHELEQK